MRPHRRSARTVQSYSPGCANVHPHLIDGSPDPRDSASQTASRSVQPFSHSSRQRVPIIYNGPPIPSQSCPFMWGIWTPSKKYGSFDQPESTTASQSCHFCRAHDRDRRTDRPTDRPFHSVCINTRHLRGTVMRPKILDRPLQGIALTRSPSLPPPRLSV